MLHTLTYTYPELLDAVYHAPDHALSAYADEYTDIDRDDMDAIWTQLQSDVIHMHAPVQLDPSTSPQGETNKYMVGHNIIAALIRDDDGHVVVKSFMTPTYKQRKWMEVN